MLGHSSNKIEGHRVYAQLQFKSGRRKWENQKTTGMREIEILKWLCDYYSSSLNGQRGIFKELKLIRRKVWKEWMLTG